MKKRGETGERRERVSQTGRLLGAKVESEKFLNLLKYGGRLLSPKDAPRKELNSKVIEDARGGKKGGIFIKGSEISKP